MSGVLLVDDDPDIREILADLLQGEGYPVTTASHGREALARMREGAIPCLIVLDLMMPVMNGWEFRREQLSDPATRDVPVVLYTGVPNPAAEAEALKAVAYVAKSVNFRAILDLVKQYC